MTDRPTSGPAPRWGEYAPVPEKAAPEKAAPERGADAVPLSELPPPTVDRTGSAPADPAPPRPPRSWDRALTIGLLAFGGLNMLWSIPQFVDFAGLLRTAYSTAGYGAYTSDGLASVLGAVAIVIQAGLLVLAVLLAGRNLRAGRVASWIPLVAGALAVVAVLVITVIAMLSDPALPAYIDGQMAVSPAASRAP